VTGSIDIDALLGAVAEARVADRLTAMLEAERAVEPALAARVAWRTVRCARLRVAGASLDRAAADLGCSRRTLESDRALVRGLAGAAPAPLGLVA